MNTIKFQNEAQNFLNGEMDCLGGHTASRLSLAKARHKLIYGRKNMWMCADASKRLGIRLYVAMRELNDSPNIAVFGLITGLICDLTLPTSGLRWSFDKAEARYPGMIEILNNCRAQVRGNWDSLTDQNIYGMLPAIRKLAKIELELEPQKVPSNISFHSPVSKERHWYNLRYSS